MVWVGSVNITILKVLHIFNTIFFTLVVEAFYVDNLYDACISDHGEYVLPTVRGLGWKHLHVWDTAMKMGNNVADSKIYK